MKKAFSVLIALTMMFIFAGCSGPNAEMSEENITETVNVSVEALKTFDTKKLDKYVESQTLSYISSFAEDHEQFSALGKAIFENLEVEITSVDVENSTVTLSVKNKELAQIAGDYAENLLNNYTKFQLLGNLSSDSWLDGNLSILTDSIATAEMRTEGVSVTLSIKQEKKNLVLCFDETAEDAVSGGALTAVKAITG